MTCLFCEMPEAKGYKPPKGVDYICSTCVQELLAADQDHLKLLHNLATIDSKPNKAWAIESFLIPEGKNATRPQKHGRRFDRNRGSRPATDKKSRIKQAKIRTKTPVL